MESLCGIGFEYKRYSRICGVDMSANPVNSKRWFTRERWGGMFTWQIPRGILWSLRRFFFSQAECFAGMRANARREDHGPESLYQR